MSDIILERRVSKVEKQFELGICTLHNEFIQYQYSFDMQRLLSDWQMLPPSDLSIPRCSLNLRHT